MMNKKKVLIVEDTEIIDILKETLEACGFEIYPARNVTEARQLAEQHWEEIDVALLDMDLKDPTEPLTTGAQIAIEFRKKKKSFPPESLIYSSKTEINFYRLALRLGAAAYLLKEEDSEIVVAQHVRVLALRRALNGENPKIAAEVARIAVHSPSQPEAILTFCQRVLKPEFEACLGVPFVILFTEGETTQNCADNAGLPNDNVAFYHTLQALAHGKGNLTEPFFLEASKLETLQDQETAISYGLNLAAFLPLSLSSNLKLSIGILHQQQSQEVARPTYAEALCTVLAQYLRPTVLENIMSIWSQWTELRATRNSTAKLCLAVGQEIKDGLETENVEQLEGLADDLNDTGQLLKKLEDYTWRDESDAISAREVVEETWKWIAQPEHPLPVKLDVQGDCMVQLQRSDLEIIVSRLLEWFVYRSKATPLGVEPMIKIKCESTDSEPAIIFEDTSDRLPEELREDMFAPFTQALSTPFAENRGAKPKEGESNIGTPTKNPPSTGRYLPLYLAKMLVEGRYHGLLKDISNEIKEHNYGHRILMQFTPVNKMS